jgi:hypothetical protein
MLYSFSLYAGGDDSIPTKKEHQLNVYAIGGGHFNLNFTKQEKRGTGMGNVASFGYGAVQEFPTFSYDLGALVKYKFKKYLTLSSGLIYYIRSSHYKADLDTITKYHSNYYLESYEYIHSLEVPLFIGVENKFMGVDIGILNSFPVYRFEVNTGLNSTIYNHGHFSNRPYQGYYLYYTCRLYFYYNKKKNIGNDIQINFQNPKYQIFDIGIRFFIKL